MNPPLLQLHNVSVSYSSAADKAPVLANVSLTVNEGDWIMIRGRNGSGKSTIFKLIVADLAASHGILQFSRMESGSLPTIFSVCQDPTRNSPSSFTAAQALWVSDCNPPAQRSAQREKYQDLLHAHGLDGTAQTLLGELSGGQRQLVSLLMASLNQPKLLLLDEPTSALDPVNEEKCLAIVEAMNRSGVTVMHITHDPGQFAKLGTRHLEMADRTVLEVMPTP